MQSRIVEKIVEIEGRRFIIHKYSSAVGLNISKMLIAKILPIAQSFFASATGGQGGALSILEAVSLEDIARALDLVKEEDFNYILKHSLMFCFEELPGGRAPVMNPNGTFGVADVEYDMLLTLRLVCEAILWGLGDFFTADRLISMFKPLLSSLPQNLRT